MSHLFEALERIFVQKKNILVFIAFGVFLIIGLSIFSDYGISWDELSQDAYGRRNIEFILGGRSFPEGWEAVYYGPVFSSTAYALACLISPHEDRLHFLAVHFITFLYFFTSVVFFFCLAKSYLRSDYWALLAAALLVTSPRIFADSFYNPKDIPFLSAMIIGFFTMQRFLENPTVRSALWHGVASAVAIDIRILGIMIPAITFILDLLNGSSISKNSRPTKNYFQAWLAYALSCLVLVVLLWSFLWADPIARFWDAFYLMGKFEWPGQNLYMGQYVIAKSVPWHYSLVWIGITTPISIIVLFLMGFFELPFEMLKIWKTPSSSTVFFLAPYLWFLIPLTAVIVFKSTLYDGWRQLYFIYPGIVLVATLGLRNFYVWVTKVGSYRVRRVIVALVIVLLSLDFFHVVSFLIRSHPHQYVYFNSLVGGVSGAKNRFEMDYWGLSFRQLLECMAKQMPNKKDVAVQGYNDPPLYMNLVTLKPNEQQKFVPLTMKNSRGESETPSEFLHLTTFRLLPLNWRSDYPVVCEIKVDGATIAAAYLVKR